MGRYTLLSDGTLRIVPADRTWNSTMLEEFTQDFLAGSGGFNIPSLNDVTAAITVNLKILATINQNTAVSDLSDNLAAGIDDFDEPTVAVIRLHPMQTEIADLLLKTGMVEHREKEFDLENVPT